MASAPDVDDALVIHRGAHIVISLGHHRQGCKHIQPGHRPGGFLDPRDFLCHLVSQLAEQIVFQGIKLILRSQNQILQFL